MIRPANRAVARRSADRSVEVRFAPIVDLTNGTVAGYRAEAAEDILATCPTASADDSASGVDDATDRRTAELIRTALEASVSMPSGTFLVIPVPVPVAASRRVLGALLSRPRLDGIVIDLHCAVTTAPSADLATAVERYRRAGALVAAGGQGAAQPCVAGIVSIRPSLLRLSRDWIRGIDSSASKRSALEMIGRVVALFDARLMTDGVCSAAELRTLAGLGVPFALGPFIGSAQADWSQIEPNAARALPHTPEIADDSPLRSLVQSAYTATDPAVAVAVLAETTGFDVVVVVDEDGAPHTVLEVTGGEGWESTEAFTISSDLSPAEAVQRALARPRSTRFTPLVCTDHAGRFVGILRIERLMSHLARG